MVRVDTEGIEVNSSKKSVSDRVSMDPSGGSSGSQDRREYRSVRSGTGGQPPGLAARALSAVGAAARGVHWYVTSLMGDRAYDTYVAHHRRTHSEEPPLTERQFWRQKMDDQDRNPGARCC